MTKKINGLLVIVLLMTGSLFAKHIIQVAPGNGTLRKAIAGATSGDILELRGGKIYSESEDAPFFINKNITIRADKNAMERPIIRRLSSPNAKNDQGDMFNLGEDARLTLFFLEFDGLNGELGSSKSLEDFISFHPGKNYHVKSLFIGRCIIHGFRGKIINGANTDFDNKNVILDSLMINETKIYHAENGFNFKYVGLKYVKLKNSTFWKIDNRAIRIQNSDPVVIINHCNFDQIGKDGRIIDSRDSKNNWLIKNCIFSNQLDPESGVLRAPSATLLINCNFWKVGKVQVGDGIVADTLRENPGYLDPGNGNFELSADSPLLSRAKYRRALGDICWDPNYKEPSDRNLLVDLLYPHQNDPLNPGSEISLIMGQGMLGAVTQTQLPGRSLFAPLYQMERERNPWYRHPGNRNCSRIYFYELCVKSYNKQDKVVLLA